MKNKNAVYDRGIDIDRKKGTLIFTCGHAKNGDVICDMCVGNIKDWLKKL